MPKASMDIGITEDGQPYLEFIPAPGADFEEVYVSIPELHRYDLVTEGKFYEDAASAVQASCGNNYCDGFVAVRLENVLGTPNLRRVASATIRCADALCPLNPPSSGDSEPLSPLPPSPSLQAEAEL